MQSQQQFATAVPVPSAPPSQMTVITTKATNAFQAVTGNAGYAIQIVIAVLGFLSAILAWAGAGAYWIDYNGTKVYLYQICTGASCSLLTNLGELTARFSASVGLLAFSGILLFVVAILACIRACKCCCAQGSPKGLQIASIVLLSFSMIFTIAGAATPPATKVGSIIASLLGGSLFSGLASGLNGLTGGLTSGLTGGLTSGLTGGLTSGLTGGLTSGLTGGLTSGLTGGLTSGLTGGLTGGLTSGLTSGLNGLSAGLSALSNIDITLAELVSSYKSLGVTWGPGYGCAVTACVFTSFQLVLASVELCGIKAAAPSPAIQRSNSTTTVVVTSPASGMPMMGAPVPTTVMMGNGMNNSNGMGSMGASMSNMGSGGMPMMASAPHPAMAMHVQAAASIPAVHVASPLQHKNNRASMPPPKLPPGWTRDGPDDAGDFWYVHADGRSQWEIPTA